MAFIGTAIGGIGGALLAGTATAGAPFDHLVAYEISFC